MKDIYLYDLFISYATVNEDIANKVVSLIEKRGYKCFIAPRNIDTGKEYASEIIRGISNSLAVMLICSTASDKSGYVLREINSAVARNKTIIPLRIESFIPSEAMEFYLGPTQWLDAFPQVLDTHIDAVTQIVDSMKRSMERESGKTEGARYKEPTLIRISEACDIGYTHRKITMKEIELDYLCIPRDKYVMNDEIEGTFEDWESAASQYEEDTSTLLVKNDEIIGYCDLYPLEDDAYADVISGKCIVRDSMIELYSLGGEFNAYIAMIAIAPEYATQTQYLMFFKWMKQRLTEWKSEDIIIKNIGISVYSSLLEKFVTKLGFTYVGLNPAKGKIYETSCEALLSRLEKIK